MQDIIEFLSLLRSLDVRLSVQDGRLSCSAPKGALTEELKEQLKERKFSLTAFLSETGQTTSASTASIAPAARDADLLPSLSQERLWFMEQFEGPSAAYNIAAGLRLTGSLNQVALENSFKEIIHRHEVLRTSIVNIDGMPKVIIRPEVDFKIQIHSLRDVAQDRQEAALIQFASDESRHPFDLTAAPLIRVYLVEFGDDDRALLFNVHHIATDGWSLGVITQEVGRLYPAFCLGQPSPLPPLPLQYVDYAQWHRRYVQNGVMQTQLPFWKKYLKGPLPVLELPYDRPRPSVMTYNGTRSRQILPKELLAEAKKFSTAESTTLFATLLAAFDLLMFRYSRQPDVVIGTVAAGRTRPEFEKLVGLFTNNLPIRTDLSGDPTVRELIGRIKENMLDAFSHQDVSFGDLVEAVQSGRDLHRSPIFQVMFILQNFPSRTIEFQKLKFTPLEFDVGTSRMDLTIEAGDQEGALELQWEYNTDLFDGATIKRMQVHYHRLLEGILANPTERISTLSMMTKAEEQAISASVENVRVDYPRESCIHDLFEQQALRRPESIAVEFGEEKLSYRELSARSNRLANRLRALGVGPNVLVGLCLDRSAEIAVALLAVLKAGGAYVPLDPQYPKDRIAFMLEDSAAKVLVTEERWLEALPQNVPSVVCVDRDRESLLHESDKLPAPLAKPENLAYVLYTSGSTGKPKGVEILHRSVVNFLTSMRLQPGLVENDRLFAVTTLSFDIAGLEFYLPLTTGACVVVAPRSAVADGLLLARFLRDANITVMQATPITWRLLLDSGWEGTSGLKILCGGEALPRELANKLLKTGSQVWNLYGPTETTIWSTIHRVDPRSGSVPIGKPIANTQIYILDEHSHPTPPGVPGELYIGGDGLAQGYFRRAELTSEKFVPNPFCSGEKLYRTGDLARWLPDKNLEYISRMDNQVKLRGYRIELGEIETALEQHPGVAQAIVLVREDNPGDQRLIGYVVAKPGTGPDTKILREALHARLPEYMIPSQFVFMESLPLTPNRKVDRRALPAPATEVLTSAQYAPPRTPSETGVVAIWQDLLKHPRVGINDNFFDLGGHSLLVVQLQSRLRQNFGHELSLVELFQRPTVSAMAILLDAKVGSTQRSVAEMVSVSRN